MFFISLALKTNGLSPTDELDEVCFSVMQEVTLDGCTGLTDSFAHTAKLIRDGELKTIPSLSAEPDEYRRDLPDLQVAYKLRAETLDNLWKTYKYFDSKAGCAFVTWNTWESSYLKAVLPKDSFWFPIREEYSLSGPLQNHDEVFGNGISLVNGPAIYKVLAVENLFRTYWLSNEYTSVEVDLRERIQSWKKEGAAAVKKYGLREDSGIKTDFFGRSIR